MKELEGVLHVWQILHLTESDVCPLLLLCSLVPPKHTHTRHIQTHTVRINIIPTIITITPTPFNMV